MKIIKTAGGVVVNQKGEVLVVNQNRDSWSLPKGHIEEGENPLEAAIREIAEESGITQLEFVKDFPPYERQRMALDGTDNESEHKIITIFLFKTDQTDLHPTDPINPEARWVKKEEVSNLLTHQKDKEFFQSIIHEIK